MNRNAESRFAQVPQVDIQRSIFDVSEEHVSSGNFGDLIPFYWTDVVPGDSFRCVTSKVVRLQTLLTPIFGSCYLDTYWFFVPMRLCWNHTKEFFGENTAGAWVPSTSYSVPTISSPSGGFAVNSIADYLGVPTGVQFSANDEQAPIALPFRAVALIANEFFRDENLTAPLNIPLGDANQTGSNGSSYITDVANGGMPFKVAKYHDYFTSCLPSSQRSAQPVGINLASKAMVTTLNSLVDGASVWPSSQLMRGQSSIEPLRMVKDDGTLPTANNGLNVVPAGQVQGGTASSSINSTIFTPSNLVADLSSASAVTVNQLRLAFQLQKYFERAARGGNRYGEFIKAMYGVTNPDQRIQRPEYLGGNRIPISVSEVTNTAQTTTDFLGDLGGKSVTSDIHQDFEKSFSEFGYVIGLCCCRYNHLYPQGLEKKWKRKDPYSYYNPLWANLGEMPVYQDEICATPTNMATKTVFGFQEAFAEMRYGNSRVSAEMRPGIANTLASWHLSDYYTTAPTLSDAWIREDKNIIDRVLAVGSSVSNQFFFDIYTKMIATRPMPMYSVPGLIDHH